jgi:hypothetical protein
VDEKKTSYRKYAEEFKLEALELLKSSEKSVGQIERVGEPNIGGTDSCGIYTLSRKTYGSPRIQASLR